MLKFLLPLAHFCGIGVPRKGRGRGGPRRPPNRPPCHLHGDYQGHLLLPSMSAISSNPRHLHVRQPQQRDQLRVWWNRGLQPSRRPRQVPLTNRVPTAQGGGPRQAVPRSPQQRHLPHLRPPLPQLSKTRRPRRQRHSCPQPPNARHDPPARSELYQGDYPPFQPHLPTTAKLRPQGRTLPLRPQGLPDMLKRRHQQFL